MKKILIVESPNKAREISSHEARRGTQGHAGDI